MAGVLAGKGSLTAIILLSHPEMRSPPVKKEQGVEELADLDIHGYSLASKWDFLK